MLGMHFRLQWVINEDMTKAILCKNIIIDTFSMNVNYMPCKFAPMLLFTSLER